MKTKGYHFEHNYGHDQQYLSSVLASLSILAFLVHTVLEWMDDPYPLLRRKLRSAKASRPSRSCCAVRARKESNSVVGRLAPHIEAIRAVLPLSYHLEIGGTVEESAKGGQSVAAGIPLLIGVVLTVLMLQLRSFSLTAMVVLTAPLGLIGVTAFLLAFNRPFGFVAMLGTIALSVMIMRNSVILVDQIR